MASTSGSPLQPPGCLVEECRQVQKAAETFRKCQPVPCGLNHMLGSSNKTRRKPPTTKPSWVTTPRLTHQVSDKFESQMRQGSKNSGNAKRRTKHAQRKRKWRKVRHRLHQALKITRRRYKRAGGKKPIVGIAGLCLSVAWAHTK